MEEIILSRGGVYLARLDPAKHVEIGKIRPVVLLTSQLILSHQPFLVFVCPLSSQSQPEFSSLHVQLPPRDNLQVASYALTEHCRSITTKRLLYPRLAQLTPKEVDLILYKFQRMIGIEQI